MEHRQERIITLSICALLLFASVLGCKMLGKRNLNRPSSSSDNNPYGGSDTMAERVGFEPTVGVNPLRFSRPVH